MALWWRFTRGSILPPKIALPAPYGIASPSTVAKHGRKKLTCIQTPPRMSAGVTSTSLCCLMGKKERFGLTAAMVKHLQDQHYSSPKLSEGRDSELITRNEQAIVNVYAR